MTRSMFLLLIIIFGYITIDIRLRISLRLSDYDFTIRNVRGWSYTYNLRLEAVKSEIKQGKYSNRIY